MKSYQIILLLHFVIFSMALPENFSIENVSDKSAILSEIIAKYLNKYFSNEDIFVSIILSASKIDQINFQKDFVIHLFENRFITEFTHNILHRMDFAVRDHRHTINFILIDDSKTLPKIVNETTVEEYQLSHKFMIILTDTEQKKSTSLNEIFEILWKNGLIHSHVLSQDENKVWSLSTFVPYQNDCSTLSLHKIQTFTSTNCTVSMKIPKEKLYKNKLKNFHRCPIRIAPSVSNPVIFPPDKNQKYRGIDIEIITQISKSLNFMNVYKRSLDGTGHGIIFANGTISGNMGMLYRGEASVAIGGYFLTSDRVALFTPTIQYLQSSFGFSFRESDAYLSVTRLTAPFHTSIWIANILFLVISAAVILLTKKLGVIQRHFLIGGHLNRTPILNMWATVLGNPIANPMMTQPRYFGTFARAITFLWIFQWLIVRNSYQGALYTFLQSTKLTSPYDTIDKIRQSDCKILVTPSAYPFIKNIFDRDRIIFTDKDFIANFPYLFEEKYEGTVALSIDITQNAFNLQNYPNRRIAFTKDRLFMYSPVFLLKKKSMLCGVFNEQLKTLRETGLIKYWVKSYTDNRREKLTQKEPSKLKMKNIFAVFEICGIMYLLSTTIFVMEMLSKKCRRVQYIIDYFTY